MNSRKLRALLVVCVLAMTVIATQAFADNRLQGAWLWEGPDHAGLLINGNNFVWIWVDGTTYVGTVSVSGNRATFTTGQFLDINDIWHNHQETWNYNFSFQTNNRLVINNWIYLRS